MGDSEEAVATTILIPDGREDAFVGRVREIIPDARLLTRSQLKAQPQLLDEIDIAYGHMSVEDFARAGRLRWMQSTSAGAGWVQDPRVREREVIVTNSHIHAEQISEHLMGMLLMLTHKLGDARLIQQQGIWKSPDGVGSIMPLSGRRLCVLGLGVIGGACAKLGRAFGMTVVGVRRRPGPDPNCEKVYGPDELADALRGADVLMNLLPGTAETRGMIGADQLAMLADGAIVLNAGRGFTIDTDALLTGLTNGKLGGAGLDVTDPEPLPSGHPLWTTPGVIITAHYSGVVADYAARTDELFLENLARFRDGQPLRDVVDPDRGY
jgi:phosphoglycerate dehydrogenase-like enzyme